MQVNFTFFDVSAFLSEVGRVEFQRETGKSAQLVQRAKDDGVFPDGWIWVVGPFCAARGISVPENLFRERAKMLKRSESAA